MTTNKELLNLYQEVRKGTATAETFENAILEQGLTCEVICILSDYYKEDVKDWRKE